MREERKIGILLSYLAQGIQALTGLLYTPIMLRLLGQNEYGLYQLVSSVVSYMGLLNFGFSSSYMRFYSRAKRKNDESEVARLNGMFMTIFLVIACICFICGAVMLTNITAIFGDGLTIEEYGTAKKLMIVMIVNLAITFPGSVFDCITTAQERFAFQNILVVIQNILNPLVTLPLLLMGYGSVAMIVVTTILTISKLIMNCWYCLKKLHVRFIFRNFNFSLLTEMWQFSFFVFLGMIVDQINWSVDRFLLGRMAGTTATAIYGVGNQIQSMYLQFSNTISGVFTPKVNRIVAESDNNTELTELFVKVGRIQFLVLALIVTGFLFLGEDFVRIWAGEAYISSYMVALLLMIPVTVPLIQNLGIEILRAKNMHKVRSIVYVFLALGNVLVSIPLIMRWNAEGAALGTAIALVLGNGLFMNWYYYRKIGLGIPYFWKQILKISRGLIIPCMVGFFVFKQVNITGYLSLGISIIIYTVIYSMSMYLFGMNEFERRLVREPMTKIIRNTGRK